MKMTPEFDDAPDFIGHVEQVVNGVVRRHLPETLVLIKINNWFGSKWLGFSGKALGALGVWNKPRNEPADNIRIPPFVPSRVVSQRSFAAPTYEEVAKPRTRRAHGSVRGLGWPDQRYWEPFRDADGRSPASASAEKEWKEDQEEQIIETKGYTISTALRKRRVEELRTTADQSRADDWEGSEQQEISQYVTSLAVASTTSEARGVRF